jgi:hypothetical protein
MTIDSEYLPEAPNLPHKLGRHLNHDDRSRAYALAPMGAPIVSVRHNHIGPVLNQGNLSSCTGNAMTQCLMTLPLWRNGWAFTENDAVSLYSLATQIDPFAGSYPPSDTGSDGLSVCKAAQQRGFISSYAHAFGLQASLESLTQQPDITGTPWLQSMYYPDADGRVHPTGGVVGGHEYLRIGVDAESHHVWFLNSWGDGWGQGGLFYMTWDDYGSLLAQGGDVTVPRVAGAPAPGPTPQPTTQHVYGTATGRYYHRGSHQVRGWVYVYDWSSPLQARAVGRYPCPVCRPVMAASVDDD